MGEVPFGFGPGSADDDDHSADPSNPASGPGPGFDMASLGAALQQLGSMLQAGGADEVGPVNWKLAHDVARQAVAGAGDPAVSDSQRRQVADAIQLADLWIDSVTQFPSCTAAPESWSRSEWLEATLPAWRQIIAPVAEQLAATMQQLLPGSEPDAGGGALSIPGLPEGLPPEFAAMAGPLLGMARAMGSAMIGMQVGQGLAALAGDVLSSGDVGVPLTRDSRAALVPENLAAFGAGLGLPEDDVRLFVALREAAHQRLFAHVPWLRARVEGAMEGYAAGIKIDQQRIEDALRDVDPAHPESIQAALSSGVFESEDSEDQRVALARLETILALTEGWVDDVVRAACSDRLPSFNQLSEVLRRRRATGGPAEKTFATLVGLELRPRRLREAAALWALLRERHGIASRDALWDHPDLLPTSVDLDDVVGFVDRCDPTEQA